MSKYLFYTLLLNLSIYGMNNNNNVGSSKGERKARKCNSLIEAFMEGKLQAEERDNEKRIIYKDYVNGSFYSQSVQKAYDTLLKEYNLVKSDMDNIRSRSVQSLVIILSKNEKCQLLGNLYESEKNELQCLRLYDFMNNNNHVPITMKIKTKKKKKKEKLQDVEKQCAIQSRIALIEQNRKNLINALKMGNIEEINAACSKRLYVKDFVSLHQDIEKMINDIIEEKESRNILLSNGSRTQCIIS